jgi:hypothetical protein
MSMCHMATLLCLITVRRLCFVNILSLSLARSFSLQTQLVLAMNVFLEIKYTFYILKSPKPYLSFPFRGITSHLALRK